MDSHRNQALALSDLERGMYGITPEYGACIAQAASICLEDQKHKSGVKLNVDGEYDGKFDLIWNIVNEQMRRCWADIGFAVEQGAYGVAALLVPTLTGFELERSIRGTGFDFWLGSKKDLLFQKKARLEVSGILKGSESEIKARVKQKKIQTRRSDRTLLPAYITIVEFSQPLSRVVKR
jgi:hypothetical protein